MQTEMVQCYWKTKQVCQYLQLSSRTLSRYQNRDEDDNPFPKPCMPGGSGCTNKWSKSVVKKWAVKEKMRLSQMAA